MLLSGAITAVILPERFFAFDAARVHAVSLVCALIVAALFACGGQFHRALFNPALSLDAVWRCGLTVEDGVAFSGAQIAGAFLGVIGAQAALNLDAVQQPLEAGSSFGATAWEFTASFLFVAASIVAVRKCRPPLLRGAAMGITFFVLNAFTPLSSFANPAATIARTLTSNALALSPSQAAWAAAAQLIGAAAASALLMRLGE